MPATPDARRRDDRGSSTVWAVLALALVVSVGLAAMGLGAAIVARHRAAAAADLAALAAANALASGRDDACEAAGRIAAAQGGALIVCGRTGAVADVMVRVDVPGPLSFGVAAVARARAGPPAGAQDP